MILSEDDYKYDKIENIIRDDLHIIFLGLN